MSKDSNKNKEYFRISNFYTSAFLFSKGLELIDIDRTDPKRSQFVFLDTPERELLIHNFNFAKEDSPEVLVDSRKFIVAIKTLKDRLYQEGV